MWVEKPPFQLTSIKEWNEICVVKKSLLGLLQVLLNGTSTVSEKMDGL